MNSEAILVFSAIGIVLVTGVWAIYFVLDHGLTQIAKMIRDLETTTRAQKGSK